MNDSGDESLPFLTRWAVRKSEARRKVHQDTDSVSDPETPIPADEVDEDETGNIAAGEDGPATEKMVPADLEDVDPESLDPETTDFSRFLKEDVPERLQRAALRRLWSSDETFANLDGLNDYDEDFTPAGIAAAAADFFRRTAETLLEDDDGTEERVPESDERFASVPETPISGRMETESVEEPGPSGEDEGNPPPSIET